MTEEQARIFIHEGLIPMVKRSDIADSSTFRTLCEDFVALGIALTSGNKVLVYAMAEYISKCQGLMNRVEIAERITEEIKKP